MEFVTLIISIPLMTHLTCHESITQAKFQSRILSFSNIGTFLVRIMVEEVLPMMADLQPRPGLFQRLSNLMNQISNSGTYRVLPYLKMISGSYIYRDWTHFLAIMSMGFEFRPRKIWLETYLFTFLLTYFPWVFLLDFFSIFLYILKTWKI